MKREIQEMQRQHENENQEMKRQHENEIQDVKSDLNSVTRDFQDMKRQLEALQKLVKKSPAAKRKLFRRLETSDGGSAYYQNEESGETVWTLPEGADVVE